MPSQNQNVNNKFVEVIFDTILVLTRQDLATSCKG